MKINEVKKEIYHAERKLISTRQTFFEINQKLNMPQTHYSNYAWFLLPITTFYIGFKYDLKVIKTLLHIFTTEFIYWTELQMASALSLVFMKIKNQLK